MTEIDRFTPGRVIAAPGNHGEIFERTTDGPYHLDRGLNRLWTDGGAGAAVADALIKTRDIHRLGGRRDGSCWIGPERYEAIGQPPASQPVTKGPNEPSMSHSVIRSA
jgi:hypothetical protein